MSINTPDYDELHLQLRTPNHAGKGVDRFRVGEVQVAVMWNAWGYSFHCPGKDVWAGYFPDQSTAIRKAHALLSTIIALSRVKAHE